MIKSYTDLDVYQMAYKYAMEVFVLTKKFPKEELYSLTSQIRRSSRSIPSNIGEGWAKRKYKNIFVKQLNDAYGSCIETKIWLDFAKDCDYITKPKHAQLKKAYNRIGAMLSSLMNRWETY